MYTVCGFIVIYWCLGPVGTTSGEFNSDSAIPVIMSNTDFLSPFHLYYFGQDRLGGWPYIILWAISSLFSTVISPIAVFSAQALLFAAAACSVSIIFPSIPFAPLLLVCSALVHPLAQQFFFEINNPYCIQISLCFVYWALRKKIGNDGSSEQTSLLLGLGIVGFLCLWTSPASIIFLFMIHLFENRKFTNVFTTRKAQALFYMMPIIGLGIEKIFQWWYRSYVNNAFASELKNYDFSVVTKTSVRFSDFFNNLFENIKVLNSGFELFIPFLVLYGIILGLYFLIKANKTPENKENIKNVSLLFCITFASITVFSMIDWVRVHHHMVRYHVPQIVLMTFSITVMVCTLKSMLINFKQTRWLNYLIAPALILYIAAWSNSFKKRHNAFANLQQEAEALVIAEDKTVILGDYWGSYVWQGLKPDKLVGIPIQGHAMRIPWSYKKINNGSQVISCFDLTAKTQFGNEFSFLKNLNVPGKCAYKSFLVKPKTDDNNKDHMHQS